MKKVKLGEVCEVLNGFAFKSLLYVNEGIRIIRITNVQKGYIEDSDPKYYPIEYRNSIEKYILKENDLLMSLTGNVGRVGLISKTMLPAALNQRVACLRTIDSLISKEYVFQFLNSDLFEQLAIRSSNGVAQKNLSTDWLKKVEITYPSVEQQKLITSTLNLIERLICCRKEQNKKLNKLVKSRFNEMFEEYPDSVFLDTYIKELRAGKSLAGEENNKNKVLKTGAVSYDYFNSSEVKNLPIDYIPLDEHKVEIGDVIISRMNTSELVGAAGYVWAINSDNIYLPDRLWKVILNDRVNPVFLWKLITNEKTKLKIKRISSGTSGSMKNISKSKFLQIRVPLPPLSLQNEFADFVAQIDKSQLAIQKSLEELETLKKSLMQEYFG